MSKEAMKLALEALENSVDLVEEDYANAVSLYGKYPSRAKRLIGMETMRDDHRKAITALREELAKPDFWEGYVPEPAHQCKWPTCQSEEYQQALAEQIKRELVGEQPAQQDPKIDIYRSFEQWKRGNVLEHGVPRTEHYSEAQLDLVEMGWHYGYDAGRAVEQALDKKAENARDLGLDYEPAQQEPVAFLVDDDLYYPEEIDWESLKEQGHTVFPLYTSPPAQQEPVAWMKRTSIPGDDWDAYDFSANQYGEFQTPLYTSPPAQRTWVGLTGKEVMDVTRKEGHELLDFIYEYGTASEGTEERVVAICKAIEAKLKEKNNG